MKRAVPNPRSPLRGRPPISPLIVVAALVVASVAGAASRVALVRPPSPDVAAREATTRLEGEMRAAGFDVVVIDSAPGVDARAQVEAARIEPRVVATIAIVSTDRGAVADVWIADHLSDKTLVRRVDVSDASSDSAASTLAVRAVELLRASLLELGGRDPPAVPPDLARLLERPAPPVVPSREPAPAPRAPPPRAPVPAPFVIDLFELPTVEVAGALLQSASGLGTAAGPMIRVSHRAPLGLRARASLFLDLARPRLEGRNGRASLHQELLVLDVARPFGERLGVLRPILSAGIGAHHLRAQGAGNLGYLGTTRSAWSFVVDAGAGLAVRLGARVAIEADVHALFLAPQPAVQIAGEDAGRAGLPMLYASLGLVLAP